jgi:hypothetical protein
MHAHGPMHAFTGMKHTHRNGCRICSLQEVLEQGRGQGQCFPVCLQIPGMLASGVVQHAGNLRGHAVKLRSVHVASVLVYLYSSIKADQRDVPA